MNIFETIFKHEYNKLEDSGISNLFLFAHNFTYTKYISHPKYTWDKYIQYKFFVLMNFLNTPSVDENTKETILNLFSITQRHVLSLCRFRTVCLFKTKKCLTDQVDLNFTPLSELPSKHTVELIHHNTKYQFSVFDLIRIINSSLSYEYNFFPEPQEIKNPWNNKPFTIHQLYNIYFFIYFSNISVPILFSRFYQSNFCLQTFEYYNQFIIKNYVIENCHLLSDNKKAHYIYCMVELYNVKNTRFCIDIDDDFPEGRLIEVMGKYIKSYLLSIYSYEKDLRFKYKILLIKKLKQFQKENSFFGRKIRCLHIKKLYYISRLYYDEKQTMNTLITDDIYLPTPSFISLQHKSYFIDFKDINDYSVFPVFNQKKQRITEYNDDHYLKSVKLQRFIANYSFTQEQLDIISTKYLPIVNSVVYTTNSISTNIVTDISDDDMSIDETVETLDTIETVETVETTETNETTETIQVIETNETTETIQVVETTETTNVVETTETNETNETTETTETNETNETDDTDDTDDTIEPDDITCNGVIHIDKENINININMECKHIIKHILDLLDDE